MAPYYLVVVLGVAGVLAAGADVVIGHREVFVKATGDGARPGAVPGPSSGVASSDAQVGTSKRPYRTLSEAVAAVRAMPAHQRCGLTVTIAAGVYGGAANVLRLTQEDSGCAGDPVVYRADPDAHAPVVLHGGAEIKPGDFKRAGKRQADLPSGLPTSRLPGLVPWRPPADSSGAAGCALMATARNCSSAAAP